MRPWHVSRYYPEIRPERLSKIKKTSDAIGGNATEIRTGQCTFFFVQWAFLRKSIKIRFEFLQCRVYI
jgi:hypothetical protein